MVDQNPPNVRWYRTPLSRERLKELATRSNGLGSLYALFHLGLLTTFLTAAVQFQLAGDWFGMVIMALGYGAVMRFSVNALHELAHGTVFTSAHLNRAGGDLFGFIAMVNRPYFWLSHREHHKYSLHSPYDREVEEPELHDLGRFLRNGIVSLDPMQSIEPIVEQSRLARGKARGAWQEYLFAGAHSHELADVKRFARWVLALHLVIAAVAITLGAWSIPALLLFGRQFGSLPFQLCNNTQHAGLPDRVDDFRLCCRTFYLSAPLRWLYWNMNYHIEHHMYPKVPCYSLAELHADIKHDLPKSKSGLWPVWREIRLAVKHQRLDMNYRLSPVVPCAGIGASDPDLDRGPVAPVCL